MSKLADVADTNPIDEISKVYPVFTVSIESPEKVAIPATAFTEVVPDILALPELGSVPNARVIVLVEVVITVSDASLTSTITSLIVLFGSDVKGSEVMTSLTGA